VFLKTLFHPSIFLYDIAFLPLLISLLPNNGCMEHKSKRKRRSVSPPTVNAEVAKACGVTPPIQSADRWLSPADVGKLLNITSEAVKQWIFKRTLPAVKQSNGFWKIKVKDLEAFIAQRIAGIQPAIAIFDYQKTPTGIEQAIGELNHRVISGINEMDFLLKTTRIYPALLFVSLPEKLDTAWPLLDRIRATKTLCKVPMLWFAWNDLPPAELDRAVAYGVRGFHKLPVAKDVLKAEITRALKT
jgi:hypothetical protein